MRQYLPLLLLLLLPPGAVGESVYRCDTEEGVIFSGKPCGPDAREFSTSADGFVLPGTSRSDRDRLEHLRALREGRDDDSTPESAPERLGYGERTELRRLRIRRDGLERDLRVSPKSSRRHQRAREQLQEVRARIRELEKREHR